MNKTIKEAEAYALALREFLGKIGTKTAIFIIPPFTVLRTVHELLKDFPVIVGAQNMHWEEKGAFTGEISPIMIRDCGAHMVELGHSERRKEFGETDFSVNKKVLAALKRGLVPLVCIGETASEKEYGVTKECVVRQAKIALRGVPQSKIGDVMFAYEPVWAIGEFGVPAEPKSANTVHRFIREAIVELYDDKVAQQVPIIYGGSVNFANAASFAMQTDIDGLFIGRSSWNVVSFLRIIQAVEKVI